MWRGLLKLYFLRKLFGGGGRTGGRGGRGGRGGCGCFGSLALVVLVVVAIFLLRSCGGDAPVSTF
ncbi:hypothetical protein [Pontibacter anaerobius]|uniref:Sporulation protein YjcZ n=1 Tax=Pontibacter anaerobius TaxID=2993940 RepID=A0ABT3RAN8_9BACT|nr:hypothetical protein [Pontibacter anaerobius]MCX2738370.1 hypothetical protein [Pontibacter anaerobius]